MKRIPSNRMPMYAEPAVSLWRSIFVVVLLLPIALLIGCSSDEIAAPATAKPAIHLSVPIELSIKQRTTTAVPGSGGRLSLTIDDITRNQVMVSLAADTGEAILPTRSMKPQDSVAFEFAGQQYSLNLEKLDNILIGEDAAKFSISGPGEGSFSEVGKIEQLIEAVARLKGATFIRNDTEHSAAEAAEHLRTKWNSARDSVTTARQFIDEIASKSSLSGEPYEIRFTDGKTITADDFLNEQLAEISSSP